MNEVRPIHPQSTQLFAESPYSRKLKRVLEDMNVVLGVAPAAQKEDVNAIIIQLEMLIAVL